MKTCKKCGSLRKEEWGNLSFKKDGIEIFLTETPYQVCSTCGSTVLSDDVKNLIQKLLEEKKAYPDSPPALYIHVKEVLGHR
ncbi:YgiT-type zinc finger protein [Neobacillus sp. YIM B02564]|uniref:YgiT-type zinc finger protein n=1 Tax=Neobacillus paridis TaxID=2803862 RepID=A0ABS1TLG7_9BACI|nr:YgiT-type zinc finger protein [Neobacillus paridis]MBL4952160.1 YgiT-type zinc finger protein [Neobacillus paridis]